MKTQLHRSLRRGLGATTTETVLLLVLIAMVVIATVKVLGGNIGGKVEFANDSVSAVSTENNEMDRLRANQRAAEERRAAGGGGASASAGEHSATARNGQGGGAAGETNDPRSRSAPSASSTPAVAPSGGCGAGFNPFLIPIVLGMIGLLGYVVVKSQKG